MVSKNEYGVDELVFKDKEVCEEYIHIISKLWPEWVKDENRIVMQFLADMCKSMNNAGYLTIDDLYTLSEDEVINKILNCGDEYLADSFIKFMNSSNVYKSDKPVTDKYWVNVKSKTRYINPLVLCENNNKRINELSESASREIIKYLSIPKNGGVYFDFDFKPY